MPREERNDAAIGPGRNPNRVTHAGPDLFRGVLGPEPKAMILRDSLFENS